jgi:hypothetical protein
MSFSFFFYYNFLSCTFLSIWYGNKIYLEFKLRYLPCYGTVVQLIFFSHYYCSVISINCLIVCLAGFWCGDRKTSPFSCHCKDMVPKSVPNRTNQYWLVPKSVPNMSYFLDNFAKKRQTINYFQLIIGWEKVIGWTPVNICCCNL